MKYAAQLRQKQSGRMFLTAQDLLEWAAKYFDYLDETPVLEEQVNVFKGVPVRYDVSKVRAATKKGLCAYLGITVYRYDQLADKDDDWKAAVELIEQSMFTQKFENAAAGLLNATIISRELGLADKQELSGPNGGAIQTEEMSPRERIAGKLASLASRGGAIGDTSDAE